MQGGENGPGCGFSPPVDPNLPPNCPTTGINYCFTQVSGEALNANPATPIVVTTDNDANSTGLPTADISHVEADASNDSCPAGRLEVNTFRLDNDTDDTDDTGGDELTFSDDAFNFIIP